MSVQPYLYMNTHLSLRTNLLALGALITLINYFLPLAYDHQITLLFLVLFIFGIPHGALDFFIDRKSSSKNNPLQLLRFLSRYLVNMLAYALVWYFLPAVGFLVFVLLTAYHFGQIDWMGRVSTYMHRVLYFFLGLNWILFLLSMHTKEAIDVFVLMGNAKWDAAFFYRISEIVLPVSFISLWVLHGFLMVFYRDLYVSRREFLFSVLQILFLAVINISLPLWLGFAFYFGVWHSVLSFDMIRRDLKLENNYNGWWVLIKKALPYALVAWLGIILFIFFRADTGDLMDIFHILFIGIAVLTLPHLQVFSKLKVAA